MYNTSKTNIMKIEKDDLKMWLRNAYNGTCHQHNTKDKIENIDIDAIYEILRSFETNNRSYDIKFSLYPMYIFSDGGIKEFLIVCKIGEFRFLLAHWRMYSGGATDEIPCGFEPFADWLYEKLKPLPDLKIEQKLVYDN